MQGATHVAHAVGRILDPASLPDDDHGPFAIYAAGNPGRTMAKVGHVFISYSRRDGEYVGRLERHLIEAGLSVWTDSGIDYGSQWPAVIAQHIDSCGAFVPIMSTRSRESEWVQREILYAQENAKPILPLLRGGKRFIELINVQEEAVTDGRLPSTRFIDRLRKLADGPLDSLRGKEGGEPEEATRRRRQRRPVDPSDDDHPRQTPTPVVGRAPLQQSRARPMKSAHVRRIPPGTTPKPDVQLTEGERQLRDMGLEWYYPNDNESQA